MSDSANSENYSGLVDCIDDFSGTYCFRYTFSYVSKGIQFATSALLVVISLILFGMFMHRYCCQKYIWAMGTILLMVACLFANMMFCWFNEDYWLFALETYLFNLYYLSIVSYVCKCYLLKYRQNTGNTLVQKLLPSRHSNSTSASSPDKIIFYSVFVAMGILYTAIFILSIISQVDPSDISKQSQPKYCQQIWYLCFQVLCIASSIVVMIIMYKHQKEQSKRLLEYEDQFKRRSTGSIISKESIQSQEKVANIPHQSHINNPLANLWIWIILNVLSQVINLIQSGLFLDSTPPQCLIVKKNPNNSNILQLIFVFLTMYMGFMGTIWYVFMISKTKEKPSIDPTKYFSDEIRITGNIQLFIPSREQTISPQL